MNEQSKISELLSKLNKDTLTREELIALIAEAERDTPGKKIDKYLQQVWQQSDSPVPFKSSPELLAAIHKKLGLESPSGKQSDHAANKPFIRLQVAAILKYAAVVIITFGLSFLLQWKGVFETDRSAAYSSAYSPMNEISVSYGSKSRMVLPDSSVINLNSGSLIRYSSDFINNREVYIEGEAFFDVKKDPAHPFYVHTSDITVKVLGTSFGIKSYPEENTIQTTVVSGSVQVLKKMTGSNDREEKIALIKSNQSVVFYKDQTVTGRETRSEENEKLSLQKSIPRITVSKKVETDLYTAWKDNVLVFRNEEFESLIPKLERWFNIKIENRYAELNDSRLTGRFDLETVEQALDALKIITPFRYKIDKNKVTIYPV